MGYYAPLLELSELIRVGARYVPISISDIHGQNSNGLTGTFLKNYINLTDVSEIKVIYRSENADSLNHCNISISIDSSDTTSGYADDTLTHVLSKDVSSYTDEHLVEVSVSGKGVRSIHILLLG